MFSYVLAAKRSNEADDTSCGEGDGMSGTSASAESGREAQTPKSLPQTKTTKKEQSTCFHSAESGAAVRVEEVATGGNTMIWCLKR